LDDRNQYHPLMELPRSRQTTSPAIWRTRCSLLTGSALTVAGVGPRSTTNNMVRTMSATMRTSPLFVVCLRGHRLPSALPLGWQHIF